MSEWVPAIPQKCPPLPKHPTLGEPTSKFPYLNADGSKSWAVFRWDLGHGKKEFRPLSLWRETDGSLKWQWKFPPSPRSLFNLDQLQARPDAPALVVEGEKTALAAALLFPEFVVVTSGSATSVGSADWRPLEGRQTVICPDVDEPGGRYAQSVTNALQGPANEVRGVTLPDGLPQGWDLADPLPDGWTLDTLHQLIRDAKPVSAPLVPRKDAPPLALQTWKASDLLALPIQERRWVWEGWIPRAKVGLLVAVSDHGKTALALQLGASIATARPFLGFPTTLEPMGVLLVSFEDDAAEDLAPRIRFAMEGMPDLSDSERICLGTNLRIANPTWTGPDVLFEGLHDELCAALDGMRTDGIEPGLLMVETLSSVTQGDENSADATRRLWATARAIAKMQDVTVMLSHHTRKETKTGKDRAGLYERIETDRIRGSSANEGAARFILQLGSIRPDEAEPAGLDPDKAMRKGYAILRASKLKAEKPAPLFLERMDAGEPGAHGWARHANGDRILASLFKSSSQTQKLTQDEALLAALWKHRGSPTREGVKADAFPELEPKKAETALKNGLQSLRAKGWLSKDRGLLTLTPSGVEQALRMVPRMVASEGENEGMERFFEGTPEASDGPSDGSIQVGASFGWMDGNTKGHHPSIQAEDIADRVLL